jgi:hypothetical protein
MRGSNRDHLAAAGSGDLRSKEVWPGFATRRCPL